MTGVRNGQKIVIKINEVKNVQNKGNSKFVKKKKKVREIILKCDKQNID